MKRYKLIQEYPGSHKKGTIVYSPHREQAYKDLKYKIKNEKDIINHIFYDEEYIENYPKFWKKI